MWQYALVTDGTHHEYVDGWSTTYDPRLHGTVISFKDRCDCLRPKEVEAMNVTEHVV